MSATTAFPESRQQPGSKDVHPQLRLTRRGRFVLIGMPLILLTAVLCSLAGLLNAPAKAADSAGDLSLTPTISVTVQAGESLWAIASQVAPDRDPREVIADIVQLNNLEERRVMPGQQLFVPSEQLASQFPGTGS